MSVAQFLRSHGHLFLSYLPLAGTFVLAMLVLPALAGIILYRTARRAFGGRLWSSRATAFLLPAGTVFAASYVWPEVFLLVPAVTGLFTAWGLRRCLGNKPRPIQVAIFVLAAVVVAAVGALLLRIARVGLWDALAMLMAAALGYLVGCFVDRQRFEWKTVALAAASTVASFAIAEILIRLVLPPLPMDYAPNSMSIRFAAVDHTRGETVFSTPFDADLDLSACTALFGDDMPYPDHLPPVTDLWQAVANRAVLHVGDSMVQGIRVDAQERFVNLLQEETPSVRQINLGVGATAPDFYFLMIRKWVPRLPVQLVVVHLFLGNDIEGLYQPFRCCADGPLLRLTGERLEQRCPTPQWREGFGESLAWFAAVSPPPAIIRQLAPVSQFARYLIAAMVGFQKRHFDGDSATVVGSDFNMQEFLQTRERANRPPSTHAEEQWRLFEAVMRALRDELAPRGVPLVVSILPLDAALDRPTPRATESYQVRGRMLGVLSRLGIEALDPWEDFESLVRQKGRDAVFLPQGDVHLNANGHRFYAAWLRRRLGARLGSASTTSPETRDVHVSAPRPTLDESRQ